MTKMRAFHLYPSFKEDARVALPEQNHHFLSGPGFFPDMKSHMKSRDQLESHENQLSKHKLTTIVTVKQMMKEIWDGMRPTYLRSLYQSMRSRMCMVIDSKGGVTKH